MDSINSTPEDQMHTDEFHAEGIEKHFNSIHNLQILNGIDLHLKKGELVAIVGASGTGKTTLLHILGTLDRPSRGKLIYQDENVFAKNDTDLSTFRDYYKKLRDKLERNNDGSFQVPIAVFLDGTDNILHFENDVNRVEKYICSL